MKNTAKFGIIVVLATVLVFSNAVFAGDENATAKNNTTNVTGNMTNVTTPINVTNATGNMTNVTTPINVTNVTGNMTNVTKGN